MNTPARTFPELQTLRALAVVGVVVYHLWPGLVPGGYVGVDVVFVISGFLITAHLERELDATGRIALPPFYPHRERRLLPAAILVLVSTTVDRRPGYPGGTRRGLPEQPISRGAQSPCFEPPLAVRLLRQDRVHLDLGGPGRLSRLGPEL